MSNADHTQTSLGSGKSPITSKSTFASRPGIALRSVTKHLQWAGIAIQGQNPWDIHVSDSRFYNACFYKGSLGLGESYMNKWWDCPRLDELFYRLLSGGGGTCTNFSLLRARLASMHALIVNRQSRTRAFIVGEHHYDAGNELYERMLDRRMTYTCGYWKDSVGLDGAQEAKLDLVCRKIGLKAGETVLDVGCGWGSFAGFAAERYGARVTGITISREQLAFAREGYAGLSAEFRLQDYREVTGQYDHVVSLGMMEHVGQKNYRTYMKKLHDCLKPGGLALIQVIGSPTSMCTTDPWLDRYIFPNSMLPSIKQIGKAIDGLFHMEDLHSFGQDYDRTLMEWHRNFEEAWPDIRASFDERFYRMWRYYLLLCAGIFRARKAQLWQIVLAKGGVPGGYFTVR